VLIEILAPKGRLLVPIVKYFNAVCAKSIRESIYVFAVFTCKRQRNIELER
jgi:hypothetical protein